MSAQGFIAVDGTNRQIVEAYVAVDGEYKLAYSPGIEVATWKLTPTTGNPYKFTIELEITSGAYSAAIYGSWQVAPLAVVGATAGALTWSMQRGPFKPKEPKTVWAEVVDLAGRVNVLETLAFTAPIPPGPPRPTFTYVGRHEFDTSCVPQPEADYYIWARIEPGYREYEDGPDRHWHIYHHHHHNHHYRLGVKVCAVVQGVRGAWSEPAYSYAQESGYESGTYTLHPTGSASYNPNYSDSSWYWRPTSEGIRVGNSGPWYQPEYRGDQAGYIFYNFNDSTHQQLRAALDLEARITRVQLRLYRRNTSHGYPGEDPRAGLQISTHGYDSQPGSRPSVISTHHGGPGFSRGEGKWIDLPTWIGYHLVRGDSGARGLAVGGFYSPYYLFDQVGWGGHGQVLITIA